MATHSSVLAWKIPKKPEAGHCTELDMTWWLNNNKQNRDKDREHGGRDRPPGVTWLLSWWLLVTCKYHQSEKNVVGSWNLRGEYWGGGGHHTKEALTFRVRMRLASSRGGRSLPGAAYHPTFSPGAACTRQHPRHPQSSLPASLPHSGERGGYSFHKAPAYPSALFLLPPLENGYASLSSSYLFLEMKLI